MSALQADLANATESSVAKHLHSLRKRAFSLLTREHILSFADQTVVSGTSLLTTLLVARFSGLGELGIYAVGISLLLCFATFQDSLILQPYIIQRHEPQGTPAEHAGASLTISVVFSAGGMLVLAVAAMGLRKWQADSELAAITRAIAAVLPFALTREFTRRFGFAHLNMGRVLLLDLAAAIIQLSVLSWLAANGHLSAVSACAALGAGCAFPTAIWLYCARSEFRTGVRHVRIALKRTWALGKWLLAGRATVQVQGMATYWISMLIGGAAVTGAYAACKSVVGIANPLLVGLVNVLMPKSALAWKEGGGPGLWHETIHSTLLITALMVPLIVMSMIGGETALRFLYHGQDVEGLGHTLTVLVVVMSAGALGMPASNALAVMERPRGIVVIGIVQAILTVLFVSLFMTQWGLLGAAYGLLAATTGGAVARWLAFSRRVSKVYDPTLVIQVLKDFTKSADASQWVIRRLGEGLDAETFLVQSREPPLWRTHYSLVVKLYKPATRLAIDAVQAQFQSLSNVEAALDGCTIDGWKILVPRPLYVSTAPLALVMTEVPGRNIDTYASKSNVTTSELFNDAARTCALALQRCWSMGQRHGDLALQNVLFMVEGAKAISFIDAGTTESCRTCNDNPEQSAEVCDLAHLVCDVAIDVLDLMGRPTMRNSRQRFVENILLTIIEGLDTAEQRRQLLDEIWVCTHQHLDDCLEESCSILGVWNVFLKQVGKYYIHLMLRRVMSRANICIGISEYEFSQAATQTTTS